MSSDHIIDTSGFNPILGPFRRLDSRSRSNAYDIWDEHLCARPGPKPTLATCVFEALAEPPDDWFDEDGELLSERLIDGQLFPPAFFDGFYVSGLQTFLCGPLTISPDGDEVSIASWSDQAIACALKELNWLTSDALIARIEAAAVAPPHASELPEPLVSAYLETDYRAQATDGSFTLRIGEKSEDLAALLEAAECRSAAFVTAWNPMGTTIPETENRQRNRLLKRDLDSVSAITVGGEGVGNDRSWPAEDSFLAIGLSFDQAVHVGRHYGQNAIIWADEECIPKLVLLR